MKKKVVAQWNKAEDIKTDISALQTKSLDSEKKHIQPRPSLSDDIDNGFEKSRKQKLDILTQHLGCTSYYMNMRWTWFGHDFFGKWKPLEVSRFYQEKNLALDIAVNQVQDIIDIKKKLLEDQGIKYYVITSSTDLKQFAEQTL